MEKEALKQPLTQAFSLLVLAPKSSLEVLFDDCILCISRTNLLLLLSDYNLEVVIIRMI